MSCVDREVFIKKGHHLLIGVKCSRKKGLQSQNDSNANLVLTFVRMNQKPSKLTGFYLQFSLHFCI